MKESERLTAYDIIAGQKTGDLKLGVSEQNAFHRLAAYEDTMLLPIEVERLKRECEERVHDYNDLKIKHDLLEVLNKDYQAENAELRAKLENGVELLKRGDNFYIAYHDMIHVEIRSIDEIRFKNDEDGKRLFVFDRNGYGGLVGDGVFLDREAAEARLKELKSE